MAGGSLEDDGGPVERGKEKKQEQSISNVRSRCTYVNQFGVVALLEIVQNGRVVQVSQIGHVLDALELWRIHRVALVFLERSLLRRVAGDRIEL